MFAAGTFGITQKAFIHSRSIYIIWLIFWAVCNTDECPCSRDIHVSEIRVDHLNGDFSLLAEHVYIFWTNSVFDTDFCPEQLHADLWFSRFLALISADIGGNSSTLFTSFFLHVGHITHICYCNNGVNGKCLVQNMNHERAAWKCQASMSVRDACTHWQHSFCLFNVAIYHF